MFTVERIEDDKVVIEDRNTKETIVLQIGDLPTNIKEGDILEKNHDSFIINEEETKKIKENIRNRFNSLID